jgi:TDG/mug DNA glycosylase family protein
VRTCDGYEVSARRSATRGATGGAAARTPSGSSRRRAARATRPRSPASSCGRSSKRRSTPGHLKRPESDVPDVLAPGLTAVFCGINPGRVSEPGEQFELLKLGIGLTNAAYRTTPGSGDLRRGDFTGAAERLERLALELRPRAIGFVGKEAYRGAFGDRPELGAQERRLGETALWVLPSTSPANAAVPWAERLRWFQAFFDALSTKGASTTSQPPS